MVPIPILTAVLGAVAGFVVQWYLQERREMYKMRNAIAPLRVKAYHELWPLCDREVETADRADRAAALWAWYSAGGGLFLSLPASTRFFSALKLLREPELDPAQIESLQTQLTWIRTEMKFHLGSYTRREARQQIPDAERASRWMPSGWRRSRSMIRRL